MIISQLREDGVVGNSGELTVVLIHENGFTRDCIIKAIAAEFTPHQVLGVASVDELARIGATGIALVLIEAGKLTLDDPTLVAKFEKIKSSCPGVAVALLSDHDDDTTALRAMSRGIRGFISSSDTLAIGIAALRLILAGGSYCRVAFSRRALNEPSRGQEVYTVAPAISPGQVASDTKTTSAPDNLPGITTRETHVLALLQQGLPNKAIASRLRLSENTVKVHVRRIMRKLNAKNRTEAVLHAQRLSPAGFEES